MNLVIITYMLKVVLSIHLDFDILIFQNVFFTIQKESGYLSTLISGKLTPLIDEDCTEMVCSFLQPQKFQDHPEPAIPNDMNVDTYMNQQRQVEGPNEIDPVHFLFDLRNNAGIVFIQDNFIKKHGFLDAMNVRTGKQNKIAM